MYSKLALVSAAALSLFCSACGGDDDKGPSTPPDQVKDTRSNVTGDHPSLLTVTVEGSGSDEPSPVTFTLTAAAGSQDVLNVDFDEYDCNLTATMTGESTFKFNPGSCTAPVTDGEGNPDPSCDGIIEVTQGTGGRASAGAKINASFSGSLRLVCRGSTAFSAPLTATLTGT
jgi:hypothetical protein